MRFAPLLLLLGCLPLLSHAAEIDASRLSRIDEAVKKSIDQNNTPGAVVVVVHGDKVVFNKAYGNKALKPAQVAMAPDTIFDMASLTKPIATATCAMVLVEQGKLRFSEKVSTYWPEFAANKKEDVTVEHLFIHTSGLTADNHINDYKEGREAALKKIANLSLEAPAGTRFRYSDVGFITLGHLVERISGKPLEVFAKETLFEPLGMKDSGYLPKNRERCAPTSERDGKWIIGDVHDPRSYAMGNVAGHAGLFSTGDDLARYARMILRGGELDGKRILGPLTVQKMIAPVAVPGGFRSRGWDVDTSFSSPRGDLFGKLDGYGHTGYTGTSIWFDEPSKTAVIILANRVHISDKASMTALRREVANIVAGAIVPTEPLTRAPEKPVGDVRCGIDVLVGENYKRLEGKKVALVTNHTGRARSGEATADLLHQAKNFKLVALMSPEHGIRGELDQSNIQDSTDAKTGLPVFSLYGKRRKPDAETLKGVDTVVYDIQDVGCRFYTFISTLGGVLEAAAANKVKVVVLDRPNPIGGLAFDGPLTDAGRESFVAYHSLPVRHGLTVGELAKMFVAEKKLDVELEVVKVEGWKRGDYFDRTGLTWINPSPNMRTLTAALLYPGIGLMEFTNISVGRGTERPFEWIGAPFIKADQFATALNQAGLPGVRFVPTHVKPVSSVHKDKDCGGVSIIIDDWKRFDTIKTGLTIAKTLQQLYPETWNPKNYDRLFVNKKTYDAFLAGKSVAEIEASWRGDLNQFRNRRKAFLLYDE